MFIACLSGQEMLLSQNVGYYAAAFGIVIAVLVLFVSLRQKILESLPLCALLLIVHPAWTMSAFNGDCGLSKRFLAVAASSLLLILLVLQPFWPRFSRLRFVLVVCIACWLSWLLLRISLLLLRPLYGGEGFIGHAVTGFAFSSKEMFSVALLLTAGLIISSQLIHV